MDRLVLDVFEVVVPNSEQLFRRILVRHKEVRLEVADIVQGLYQPPGKIFEDGAFNKACELVRQRVSVFVEDKVGVAIDRYQFC